MYIELVRLSDLVTIHSGVTIREKIVNDPHGDTHVIQMRDIRRDFTGFDNTPFLVNGGQFRDNSFLKSGDVMFMAKGQNNYAIPYRGDFEKAVAVSFFFILKEREEVRGALDPFFLCWFINSGQAKRQLAQGREGTQIRNINKKTLEGLKIKLPLLKEQKLIAKIYQLQQKETTLLKVIEEKRRISTAQKISNFLNNKL